MDYEGHGEESMELEEGREAGPRWAQLEEEVRFLCDNGSHLCKKIIFSTFLHTPSLPASVGEKETVQRVLRCAYLLMTKGPARFVVCSAGLRSRSHTLEDYRSNL